MSSDCLVINEEPVSLNQILDYLQVAGKLQPFLWEILNQHTLAKELETRPELIPKSEIIDQLLNDFCQQYQLLDDEAFQAWLQQNQLDYASFCTQLVRKWTLQQLQQQVSQPKLHEHFIKRKLSLDRILLSYIVVDSEELAKELRDQTEEGKPFDQLAKIYSLAENGSRGGKMEPLSREELQDELRAAIDAAQVGDVIGPLAINDQWYLFRLEDVLLASLEGALKEQLEAELFEEWLAKKVANMNIKLKVEQWLPIKTTFGH